MIKMKEKNYEVMSANEGRCLKHLPTQKSTKEPDFRE